MPKLHILHAVIVIDDQGNESIFATSELSVGGFQAQLATSDRHTAEKMLAIANENFVPGMKNPETGRPLKALELRRFCSGDVQ